MTQTVDTLRADIAALEDGLIKADSAGDTESATRYAKAREKAKKRLALVQSNPGEYDPESDAFKERYGAISGMSNTEKFLAGFDKAVSDFGLGLKQRGMEAANFIPGVDLDAVLEKTRAQVERSRERDAALLEDNFGFTGNLVGDIVSKAPAMSTGPGFVRAGAVGALEGLTRPTSSAADTALNTATGGVFGVVGEGAGRLFGRAFRPVADSNSTATREAVEFLQKEGIDMDVGQRTGSAATRRISSVLGDNPITATQQANFVDKQRRQFTRAVLKTINQQGDEVSEQVLNNARTAISRQLDSAAKRNPAFFDTEFARSFNNIRAKAKDGLLPDQFALFDQQMQRLLSSVDPKTSRIPGDSFITIRSALSNLKRQPVIMDFARELEDEMLLALERGGGSRAGIREALAKYRNIKIIENAIDKDADRLVSPLRLSNTMNNLRNRNLFLRGLGHEKNKQLANLARFARGILPDATPQSGTFPRMLMGEGILFAGGAGAAAASGQDITDAAKVGAGVAAAPLVLQSLLNNQGVVGDLIARGLPGQAAANSQLAGTLGRQGVTSLGLLSEEKNR